MASQIKKKQGNFGFIFTLVLVALLAAATIVVVSKYNAGHSSFIKNDSIAEALASGFGKSVNKVTKEDAASVEGLSLYKYDNDTIQMYKQIGYELTDSVSVYLPGYFEAYEAYNKEDITDEEKAELTDPSTLVANVSISDIDISEDMKLFSGLKRFYYVNYADAIKYDPLADAAAYCTGLEEFCCAGVKIDDFSLVEKLPGLKTLAVNGAGLTDISAVKSLKNLETLDLSDNNISDISALASLDNEKIQSVSLTGNSIEDYSALEHLDKEKYTTDLTVAEAQAEAEAQAAAEAEEAEEEESEETEETEESEESEETEETEETEEPEESEETEEETEG